MQTYVAEISEILRAEKRDDEHLARLEANFSKLLKDLVGVHSWIRFYRYIPVFVKTLYYACTTLSGVQTLGEEYLALLQVSSSGGKVAVSSLYKRFVFVFLNIFAPILLEILLRKLDQHINQIDTNKFFGVPLRGNQKARQTFTKIFDWIRLKGIPSAYRLHIAIFYLYGSYYSLSKRFSGISYLSVRPQTNLQASRLLKFIAYLTVLQFSIAVVSWIYENFFCQLLEHDKGVDIDSENDSELIELGESEQSTSELTRFSCGICQSTHYPSCLPCGHLYCWYCIIQHAHECSLIQERQPYCPHCRSSFEASRVMLTVFNSALCRSNISGIRDIFEKISPTLIRCHIRYQINRRVTSNASRHPTVYFSGIQPTGVPHLGNYFGFIQPWLSIQRKEPLTSALFLSIADYHSISTGLLQREEMRSNILNMAAGLLACGVDPQRTTLFQQSEVLEHTNLMFILGALQTVTKLQRMPQFKDKAKRYKSGEVPVNLLIYPVLQTADVLLYKGTHVPVGEDQTQHMNLLTDLAVRFNSTIGIDYFPVPVQVTGSYARIKSLRDPSKKMSKSDLNRRSRIDINDTKTVIFEKCAKALSDFESTITYEPQRRPAISNLITIYSALTGKTPEEIVAECAGKDTKHFKHALSCELDQHFAPIRDRFNALIADESTLKDILFDGAQKARKTAARNVEELKEIIGFKL